MIGCVLGICDVINWAAIKNNAVTFLLVMHQSTDVVIHLDSVVKSGAFLAKANIIAFSMQCSKRFFFANIVRMTLNPVVHKCAFPL